MRAEGCVRTARRGHARNHPYTPRMFKFALKAAADEVIPFLRRMETSLDQGSSIEEAYTDSLRETTVLKRVVGEPVEGLPFSEGLVAGAKKSQLRPLIFFANQVRLRESGGDGLKEALKKAVVTTARLEGEQQRSSRNSMRFRNRKLLWIGGAAAASFIIATRLRR
jgi:hypothetical protein